MDLDLSSDQSMLLSAVEPLLLQYRQLPQPQGADYLVPGKALDDELALGGFYGDDDGPGLELADAALLLDQVAQLPYALPAMASLIVAPRVAPGLARPVALIDRLDPNAPVRFLAECRSALIIDGDSVYTLDLAGAAIEPVETIFAYPYARLADFDRAALVRIDATPEEVRLLWRLGLTFEMLGALRAALALTVDYTKQREQFKRPIGSFQAVQHRLGEGATRIEALHYLGYRAALSADPAEVALAATYAQSHAPQMIYDVHQFHGAVGLALEYVLHHWTYKLKVLLGELGGASAQARAASKARWPTAA